MKNVSNKVFLRMLSKVNACEEAREWVKQNGGDSATLFRECERGDWMAWVIARMELVDKRPLVGALADIAAQSLKYFEAKYPKDKRVREGIATCRRYAKGKATDEELNAAPYAPYATYAATYAADAATYAVARMKSLKKSADILRKHFPDLVQE